MRSESDVAGSLAVPETRWSCLVNGLLAAREEVTLANPARSRTATGSRAPEKCAVSFVQGLIRGCFEDEPMCARKPMNPTHRCSPPASWHGSHTCAQDSHAKGHHRPSPTPTRKRGDSAISNSCGSWFSAARQPIPSCSQRCCRRKRRGDSRRPCRSGLAGCSPPGSRPARAEYSSPGWDGHWQR